MYRTMKCFIAIEEYIPNKNDFEHACAYTDPISLKMIGDLILHPKEAHTVHFRRYVEIIDFLDGNGFKVEGNDTEGYTISLA